MSYGLVAVNLRDQCFEHVYFVNKCVKIVNIVKYFRQNILFKRFNKKIILVSKMVYSKLPTE